MSRLITMTSEWMVIRGNQPVTANPSWTVELPQNGRQQIGQVLREQARTKKTGRRTMHPDAGSRRPECIHALGEQTQNHAAKHVAGARGGQARGCIRVDDGAAVG